MNAIIQNNEFPSRVMNQSSSSDRGNNSTKRLRNEEESSDSEQRLKVPRNAIKLRELWTGFHRDTIVIKVVSSAIERPWGEKSGNGKLFSALVGDSTGEMKVIGFNAVVDKFRDKFNRDTILELGFFSCRISKEAFRCTVSRMEIVLSISSTVKPLNDMSEDDFAYQRSYTNLRTVNITQSETIIHICGIVIDRDELQTLTRRKSGEPITKREVKIVDENENPLTLTLWEKHVNAFEDLTAPVVTISNVKIKQYKGKVYGNLTEFSSIDVTERNPRAKEIRQWWQTRDSKPITELESSTEDKTFLSIIESDRGAQKFHSFWNEVCITTIKTSGCLYKSCTRNGCLKKLQEKDNGELICPKCNTVVNSFKWRMLLKATMQDSTHEVWITAFHEVRS